MIDDETPIYDRPGFLTPKDRKFLEDVPEDINDHAEKRHRIRQRTRSAFRDFSMLYDNLPEKDRKMIFEGVDSHPIKRCMGEDDFFEQLTKTLAFVCMGIAENSYISYQPRGSNPTGHHVVLFEEILSEAIKKVYEDKLGFITNHIGLEIESYDQEEIEELRQSLEDKARPNNEKHHTILSAEAVRKLVAAGEIEIAASDIEKLKDVTDRE